MCLCASARVHSYVHVPFILNPKDPAYGSGLMSMGSVGDYTGPSSVGADVASSYSV